MYQWLEEMLSTYYIKENCIKESIRGTIERLAHRETGRKVICRRFRGSGEVYRRLLSVDDRHLPRILEVAEEDGQVMVLEEYISGQSLEELLRERLLDPREAAEIGRQLCLGLRTLHRISAVHRDVKPDNVLLSNRGAVLIDFDAARIHRPEQSTDTQVIGTTGYAAPEQFGLGQSDARTDIYSMGVLLNAMVTGEHPSQRLAEGRLGRVVSRCTMMDPNKRYQTALQLRDALR